MKLRIGTRGSALALWQAGEAARSLGAAGHDCELVIISTMGDRRTDVALADIGGKGLFVKEIEEALLDGRIDIAVHSLKDVPSIVDPEFELTAFLPRADARDVLVHPTARQISELPRGGRVGTSSPRRAAQLRRLRDDLTIVPIRGNVETRAARVARGECDAVILAAAGLQRLDSPVQRTPIEVEQMLPAAGQGIIALEILASRVELRAMTLLVNDELAAGAARIERGVLQRFGTRLDCHSCIAVYAEPGADTRRVQAFVSDRRGSQAIRTDIRGGDDETLIGRTFQQLCDGGAIALLDEGER